MPISKKWSKMTRVSIKQKAPSSPGVYELTSFGERRPLYIGRTQNLQQRLLRHLSESRPNKFRFEKAGWLTSPKALERKHFEQYVNKYGAIPPWNTQDPRSTPRF